MCTAIFMLLAFIEDFLVILIFGWVIIIKTGSKWNHIKCHIYIIYKFHLSSFINEKYLNIQFALLTPSTRLFNLFLSLCSCINDSSIMRLINYCLL